MSRTEPAPRSRLVQALRAALVPLLTQGTWAQIEKDHAKVELMWRPDLAPGSGKPRYVEPVLAQVPDEEVIAVARRVVDRLTDRRLIAVEDSLFWIEADGVAHVTEVTRLALAAALDGWRLHPEELPNDVLGRFAEGGQGASFKYDETNHVVMFEHDLPAFFNSRPSAPTVTRHLALLDAYGFRQWPDARLFQLLELIVHPTVRRGDERARLVDVLNRVLAADRFELFAMEQMSGHDVFKVRRIVAGVDGRPKNLIFASTGPKPELGFVDAVNNDIVILANGEHCLVYDEPFGADGLRWESLVQWWAKREGLGATDQTTRRGLGARLQKSLASEPERRFFSAYFSVVRPQLGEALPALVPQVYLHYDPLTLRELRERGEGGRFDVQRMDFLLLLPNGVRVIVEIDGQQHYATGMESTAKPSPAEYARTVRSDRHLRLAGYDVYRFGGYELRNDESCRAVVAEFFTRLFRKHGLASASKR